MITIEFDEIVRNLNQALEEVYDEVEKKTWKNKQEAYNYLIYRFGSGIIPRLRIYEDGKRTRF